MSTTTLSPMSPVYGDEAELLPYRALSRSAVISVVLGVISLLGYLFEPMLVIAAAGLVMGLIALQAIRRYPQEYTGRGVALFGAVLSGFVFVTGATYHVIVYCTEVPDGYERVSFSQLQPDLLNEPGQPIPSSAFELDGKRSSSKATRTSSSPAWARSITSCSSPTWANAASATKPPSPRT